MVENTPRRNRDLIRKYTGKQIIEIDHDVYIPIVDNILYKGDLVVLGGKYKANKSTFAMQLACSISCGKPFLNTFNVPKAHPVWIFSTEGKDDETRERFLRMIKAVPADLDNITLFCSTQLKINTPDGIKDLQRLVENTPQDRLPGFIVIDSVYSGFKGSLTKDDIVNDYMTNVRWLSENCNDASTLLSHHYKKVTDDKDGNKRHQTDEDIYGSVFFMGQADTVFTIEKSSKDKMARVVKCETQRSNKIVEEMHLLLNEPDPFFLSMADAHDKEKVLISAVILKEPKGLSAGDIIAKVPCGKSTTYAVLGKLLSDGTIFKSSKYSGLYIHSQFRDMPLEPKIVAIL